MFRKCSATFLGILCFIGMLFLATTTLLSQYHLEQEQELSAMQQESLDRDLEIIASQNGYIFELEKRLEFLIPMLADDDVEVTE